MECWRRATQRGDSPVCMGNRFLTRRNTLTGYPNYEGRASLGGVGLAFCQAVTLKLT